MENLTFLDFLVLKSVLKILVLKWRPIQNFVEKKTTSNLSLTRSKDIYIHDYQNSITFYYFIPMLSAVFCISLIILRTQN